MLERGRDKYLDSSWSAGLTVFSIELELTPGSSQNLTGGLSINTSGSKVETSIGGASRIMALIRSNIVCEMCLILNLGSKTDPRQTKHNLCKVELCGLNTQPTAYRMSMRHSSYCWRCRKQAKILSIGISQSSAVECNFSEMFTAVCDSGKWEVLKKAQFV